MVQGTFREQVIEKFIAALGEPEVSQVEVGKLFRWSLRRPRYITMYVTIDAPEFPDMAHIMVSDGSVHQVDPLVTLTVRTHAEADAILERIIKQWKSFAPTNGDGQLTREHFPAANAPPRKTR